VVRGKNSRIGDFEGWAVVKGIIKSIGNCERWALGSGEGQK
jgi:hypothetical protein